MGKRAERRRLIRGLAALALAGAAWAGPVAAGECAARTLQLRGEWGEARFTVEVADTEAERAQGLMFREKMASGAGMLFVYQRTQSVAFWMRNTLIPLDMLFADETGVIRHIHHMAVPLDETPIPGGRAIRYVLEINGGLAEGLGITVGSQMRHPALVQEIAAWPC